MIKCCWVVGNKRRAYVGRMNVVNGFAGGENANVALGTAHIANVALAGSDQLTDIDESIGKLVVNDKTEC